MIVIDASALAETILQMPAAAAVERRISANAKSLHAPHLIDLEIAHVVRRYAATGVIAQERGGEILANLAEIPLRRHRHTGLLPRIWELRHNLSAYDAAYVALAEALDARLLTRDAKLAGSSGHSADIELV